MIKRGVLVTGAVSGVLGLLQVGWPGWVALLLLFGFACGVVFTRKGNDGACRLLATWKGTPVSPQVSATPEEGA